LLLYETRNGRTPEKKQMFQTVRDVNELYLFRETDARATRLSMKNWRCRLRSRTEL